MIDNLCFKAFLSLPSPGLANLGCQSDNNVPSLDSAQLVGKFSLNSAQLVGRFLKAELIRRINNGQVNFYIYSLKHQRSLLSMLLPSQSSEDRRGSSPVQFQVRKHLCTENSPSSEKVFQFWRTLQSPVPGSNTQRISPALILILILCFNFGEVSSPI